MNRRHIYILLAALVVMGIVGCSTKKNTANTRLYHAFTARYNTYYNGHVAYKDGVQELERANKDNYMELIPYFPIGNKKSVGSGSGNFDRAIEKSQKAIKQHSIKKKPVRKPGQKKTEKLIRWYAKKEYNPFIHKAWFLMGKAQFQKGEFLEAASTFSYIARLYIGDPDKVAEARLWMARCYTELEWYYDAEDVLGKARRDSMPRSLEADRTATYSNLLLKQGKLEEALPYLEQAVRRESGGLQRARHYFLLGQVYQQLGNTTAAYKAYSKVIRQNPPYEMEFNARIKQTEVASSGESERTVKRLKTMARSPKNKDYLDQVYYAIGNVYLAKRDTAEAIKNYETGAKESTRGGVEKGILLLRLGNLYWEQTDYSNAQRCYAEVIGLLEDKESAEYKTVSHRSEVLDELVGYAEAVELQDSLQRLAAMPEAERMKVIEQIIERVKEEEEKAREEAELAERMAARDEALSEAANRNTANVRTPAANLSGDRSWYFYNTQLVAQGKGEFQRKWGRRTLEDNWRRKNKTVVNTHEFAGFDYAAEDSLAALNDSVAVDTLALASNVSDSLVTDNKNPQFYIQQLPLTEEAMAESNAVLSDGLYHCGLIYKDKLEDFTLAEETFNRLQRDFPDFEQMEIVYYNLFLMYSRWGKTDMASVALDSLKSRYPQGDYTVLLSDPDYAYNALHGKHLEDSLYAATYTAYMQGDYVAVAGNASCSSEKYPLGKHRPKFMFLDAMGQLENGNQQGFLDNLKVIVEKYPEHEITELAGLILKGVQEGRLLRSGSFSVGSLWSRRRGSGLAGDSLSVDSVPPFSAESTDPYLFILAYEEGTVNENLLLFEVARYNFSNFMVRNFDIQFIKDAGIAMMQVGEFMNFMECRQYMQRLFAAPGMSEKLDGIRVVLISKPNYELLMNYYSFDDYQLFYEQHLDALPMPEMDGYLFDEPQMLNADEAEQLENQEEWEETEE
ncbi:MAG: tetratricopeptide repeat protein [Bacteroidaceae bacterium]|nr:tetratricopeptide repeat protein [Bacteroidaceae bacterium]